jgi:hypothetical protein
VGVVVAWHERTAGIVHIEQWEALLEGRIPEDDTVTSEETAVLDADWAAYKADPDIAKTFEHVKRELQEEGA